jgi:hypothetical protein
MVGHPCWALPALCQAGAAGLAVATRSSMFCPVLPRTACPAVFMLYITGRHEASGTVLQGSLNLVDLAGRWAGGEAALRGWQGGRAVCAALGGWKRGRMSRGGWMACSVGTGQIAFCCMPLPTPQRGLLLFPCCSERLARSQAEGQRAKEACNINKSLSSLGDVFQVWGGRRDACGLVGGWVPAGLSGGWMGSPEGRLLVRPHVLAA